MWYLLNFENHQFISCDNAHVAEAKIRSLLAAGCPKDSLEIVDAYGNESRMPVDMFRALCEEQGWVDNSVVASLVEKEVAVATAQPEKTVAEELTFVPEKVVPESNLVAAKQCLVDNGIDVDEAETVLQALGYILLDSELYPETRGANQDTPSLDDAISAAQKLSGERLPMPGTPEPVR